MSTTTRHVIAALVQNEPGVLAHVAGMFAARGFNIDSLVVGRTLNPEFSRMTMVIVGDDAVLEQVRKQLAKIVEVVKVVDYHQVAFVERDLTLIRVSAPTGKRSEVLELANMFRGRVVDVGRDELMIELSGTEEKIEAFVDLIEPYGIVELARTGLIAMPRSEKVEGVTPIDRRQRPPRMSDGAPATPQIDPGDLPPG
jgi:acetolactate synthase-1/3 small subunit